MQTLVEIAQIEGRVLFDSNSLRVYDFLDSTYPVRRYQELDEGILIDVLENIKDFLKFVRRRNTVTIEKTYRDFENLQRKIESKKNFLDGEQLRIPPRYTTPPSLRKQQLFHSISNSVFELLRHTNSKMFRPEDSELYDKLHKLVVDIWYSSPKSLLPVFLDRWREMYAIAFYLCLQQNSVALVRRTKTFATGLDFLAAHMTYYFPLLDLQKYPIRIYSDVGSVPNLLIYPTQK